MIDSLCELHYKHELFIVSQTTGVRPVVSGSSPRQNTPSRGCHFPCSPPAVKFICRTCRFTPKAASMLSGGALAQEEVSLWFPVSNQHQHEELGLGYSFPSASRAYFTPLVTQAGKGRERWANFHCQTFLTWSSWLLRLKSSSFHLLAWPPPPPIWLFPPFFLSREINCPFTYWAISLNHNSVFIIHFNWHAITLIFGVQCNK